MNGGPGGAAANPMKITSSSATLRAGDSLQFSATITATITLDQYAGTLANWFEVPRADLPTIFPNLPNFSNPIFELCRVTGYQDRARARCDPLYDGPSSRRGMTSYGVEQDSQRRDVFRFHVTIDQKTLPIFDHVIGKNVGR